MGNGTSGLRATPCSRKTTGNCVQTLTLTLGLRWNISSMTEAKGTLSTINLGSQGFSMARAVREQLTIRQE